MMSARSQLAAMPLVPRFTVVGSTTMGIVGGLVGLVLGLRAFPATAWFTVFEVGAPAGVAGAIGGAFIGLVAVTVRKIIHP